MIKTWYRDKPEGWTLVSGIWSPVYIQLRPLSSYPNSKDILTKVGMTMGRMIGEEMPHVNKLVGVAAAGIPVAIATTIFSGIPSCYTRKFEHLRTLTDFEQYIASYGEHALIEGELEEGDVLAIVDDLATKFDSKQLALEQVKYEVKRREKANGKKLNVTCSDVAVLLDREQGASEKAENLGLKLHSIIPFKSKGIHWLKGKMATEESKIILDYLANEKKYQNKQLQKEIVKLAPNR